MRYALLFSWLCFNLCAQAAKQPDIVFFLIDDLGYADCGFNGGKEIKTPNIDRLAKKGLVFSGRSPDGILMEFMELPSHPYFTGTQAHPEFKSRPMKPAPLFDGLIKAAKKKKE